MTTNHQITIKLSYSTRNLLILFLIFMGLFCGSIGLIFLQAHLNSSLKCLSIGKEVEKSDVNLGLKNTSKGNYSAFESSSSDRLFFKCNDQTLNDKNVRHFENFNCSKTLKF